ncbi:BTAD domain-containing putative transcriptional regulator [Actinosynnema sp. NPDC051121]
MIEFGVLGPLRVRVDGREVPVPSGLGRTLLAALLLRAGEVVPAELLVDRLWGGAPPNPGRAKATLQMVVRRLRQALGEANVVRTTTNGYVADVPPGALDLHEFRALAGQGRFAEALALWRGEPLSDVSHTEDVASLLEERLTVLERRVAADLASGRAAELVPQLRELTARHPLRERFWGQLMLALARSGRQAEALAAYQEVRGLLADELGVDPGEHLRDVHHQVLGIGPRGQPIAPRQLPADVRSFTGRHGEIAALDRLAGNARVAAVVAITGMGGLGKTALAVHWAHGVAADFPDGQLLVNLRGYDHDLRPLSPGQALTHLLGGLGVAPERIPVALDDQVALYRSLVADRRLLVVLDNAADVAQVRPLLPPGRGNFTVVTGRDDLRGLVALDDAVLLRLDGLSPAEGVDLLRRILGPDRVDAEPDAVAELVEVCAGLPLALRVAAATLTAEPGGVAEYVAALRSGDRLAELAIPGDLPAAVRSAFTLSHRKLTPTARRLFELLGLHPGPDISPSAIASLAALPLAEVRRALVELTQAHLVAEHVKGRYSLHDLLRAYAVELAGAQHPPAELREAETRLIDHFLHTAEQADKALYPERRPVDPPPAGPCVRPERVESHAAALDWFRTEFRTLLAVAGHAAEHASDARAWLIPECTATFFHSSGHWSEWMDVCGKALAAAERLGDVRGRADMHRGLGRSSTLLHRWTEGREHLEIARRLFHDLGDGASEAYVLINISGIDELNNRPAEALPLQLAALELFRELGHAHGQARALTSASWSYFLLGRYEEAALHATAAIERYEGMTDLPGHAAAIDNLGLAYRELGRLEEARVVQRKAVDRFAESGDRYYEAGAWRELAETHRRAGAPEAARAALLNALTIFEALGHPHADEVRRELGEPA